MALHAERRRRRWPDERPRIAWRFSSDWFRQELKTRTLIVAAVGFAVAAIPVSFRRLATGHFQSGT